MTYDEIIKALHREVAKLQLGSMNDDHFVDLIDRLMNLGEYDDAFLGVLDHSSFRPDFLRHVSRAMARLGIAMPSNADESVWALLRLHMPEMANPKNDTLGVLCTLMSDVYWAYDFSLSAKANRGDSHGIEDLISWYWAYDHLWDAYSPDTPPTSETEDIAKSVREAAVAWLNRFHAQN